ncbi:MAG TPA: threonine/serine exporter family protein [Clostridia bacterium]|nr:threonine/serine exporter family protein [Clostridia bacterium]
MQPNELMSIALKAGEIMLTSGAEIYRVEETIVRICKSYDTYCESFVLPTGIFISIRDSEGSMHTAFKRIHDRKVDLSRIDRVNNLSRSLQVSRPDYESVLAGLNDIETIRQHAFPARLVAASVSSFAFTILFQGTWLDGAAAAVIGAIAYLVNEMMSRKNLYQFLELFIAGMLAGFISLAAVQLFPVLSVYKIIIGSIMIYLPGVSITNGIKDALYGDLVASLTRLGEALLLVTVLAAGVGIALSVGIGRW